MIANREGGVASRLSERPAAPGARRPSFTSDSLDTACQKTAEWLLDRQHDDGYWVGELEGDTILESEYILLLTFLGQETDPACGALARYIVDQQLECGGWAIHPGGAVDVSASVKAYFVLKILGYDPESPLMARARRAILAAGGAPACNSFTRFYLALLGQIPYDECPYVPPELVLIPPRWRFSLSAMSAWTRTIVVPLTIMAYHKPVRRLPAEQGIGELFPTGRSTPARRTKQLVSWTNCFLAVDRLLKLYDRLAPASWRAPALAAAERWMLEHCEGTDGLGAIFPPMIYSIVAFRCMGLELDSPRIAWALRELEALRIEEGDRIRVQPCLSPVWDTAITAIALADAGLPDDHPAWGRAIDWLLEKEIRKPGDWSVCGPRVEPTGWHFQFHNPFYPDIDDSAMVLLALARSPLSRTPAVQAAIQRGVSWLLAMQNRDGGWAAYDVDIDNQVLTKLPFADHNAMLDPSCADITARVLELFGTLGYAIDHPAVVKGLEYLFATQEPEGCWYGRWGVNYVYGTWQVLQGLRAIGYPMDHPAIERAVGWLESVQQPSGGWGETCLSYEDPALKGTGERTASQTAWAVLGLVSAGRHESAAARRGVEFLVSTQTEAGDWDEAEFTGTGFPRVFYLRYHMYRVYFPLMALARYREATPGQEGRAGADAAQGIAAESVSREA